MEHCELENILRTFKLKMNWMKFTRPQEIFISEKVTSILEKDKYTTAHKITIRTLSKNLGNNYWHLS